MYDERFGTDWESLSVESAIRRMYALGVAAGLGRGLPEERERVSGAAERAYTQKLLDLAYQEGQSKARSADVRDPDAAFQELISETPSVLQSGNGDTSSGSKSDETGEAGGGSGHGSRGRDESGDAEGPPDALGVPSLLEEDGDDLDRLGVPDMLERGSDE